MIKGYNESEKYLAKICEKTFLSLYSYPNVFRGRVPASELCDLLVVVGDDIIIFSDKHCVYGNHERPEVNWSRWVRSAIFDSKKQLRGAESAIRNFPNEVFLDPRKTRKFPIPIDITSASRFHLVLIAHGTRESCIKHFGSGSGSLILNTIIKSQNDHILPFHIGDISESKTFIHIFDDASFELILTTLDTVTDFVTYLTRRERFLTSGLAITVTGEEELLAYYLKTYNSDGEHDFIYPEASDFGGILFEEGIWNSLQESELFHRKLEADKVSLFWDNLIERFIRHAVNGTQDYVSSGGFYDAEMAIRFLAKETRFARRNLSESFIEVLSGPLKRKYKRVRVMPLQPSGIIYVFGAFPHHNPKEETLREYRDFRRLMLESYCFVTRLLYPDSKFVIAIGMEGGLDTSKQSEDLVCFDCSNWDSNLQKHATELHLVHGYLKNTTQSERYFSEYPRN